MVDSADKLAYFQAITGLEDPDLCTQILQAHNWDLELAVSSFTSNHNNDPLSSSSTTATTTTAVEPSISPVHRYDSTAISPVAPPPPGLAWKIITLPISIISGSLRILSGAVGFGFWAAGGILSYPLGFIGLGSSSGRGGDSSAQLVTVSAASREALEFVAQFERDYGASGSSMPNFVGEGFMDALTSAFVNENFVAWGGSLRGSEGFKMSNSLKASRFPFCAVVMPATNQRIALLQQANAMHEVDGCVLSGEGIVPCFNSARESVKGDSIWRLRVQKSPEEMLMTLQRVLEESASVLVAARLEAEERTANIRLREEQDAAYRAALEADQAREQQLREEQERLEREAAEAERKRKEEEEAQERAAREAAEKEAALARMRQEKALSLGAEPEKGPDVTQVLVRFPTGDRKERRFHSTATIQSLYDYVDSLGCLDVENYSLVSNFPRVVYGTDKLSLSLKEAGLHPQAGLFVELN
ncbi:hypothetical protein OIU76_003857 [Salix suchowensis]|nr:hypothetical protein OIU76_003857 [Salix suchowensis]